jgi:hypothetical protein
MISIPALLSMGVDKDTPVGFKEIRLRIEVNSGADPQQLGKLLHLTERYCVVYQTLRKSPDLVSSLQLGEHHGARQERQAAVRQGGWQVGKKRDAPAEKRHVEKRPFGQDGEEPQTGDRDRALRGAEEGRQSAPAAQGPAIETHGTADKRRWSINSECIRLAVSARRKFTVRGGALGEREGPE